MILDMLGQQQCAQGCRHLHGLWIALAAFSFELAIMKGHHGQNPFSFLEL